MEILPPKFADHEEPLYPSSAPVKTEVSIMGKKSVFWTYGNPDNPTIVMLHGYRGDHHGLEKIATNIEDFCVIMPDLPGFGESEPLENEDQNIEGFANWTTQFIDSVSSGEELILVGHSFGSTVAAATMSLGKSPTPKKLILINPIAAPPILVSNRIATISTILFHQLAEVLPEKWGTSLLRNPLVGRVTGLATMTTTDPQLRRWIHEQHSRYFSTFTDRKSLLAAFDTAMHQTVGFYAKDILLPTLLIAGEADSLAPLPDQQRLLKMIPTAQLETISNVGHLTHYETPKDVAAIISAFAKETS